jgi:hypothetical protein
MNFVKPQCRVLTTNFGKAVNSPTIINDYLKTDYGKVRRPLRPLDTITWADVEAHQTFG